MRKIDEAKFALKRQLILEAAGRCFGRDGFQGASISSICAEAGVSPGHLYHYFASKDAIIGGIVDNVLEHLTEQLAAVADRKDFVPALVAEIERAASDAEHGCPSKRLPLEMMAAARRSPAVAELFATHSLRFRGVLSNVLREAQARGKVDPDLDSDVAATLLLSVMDGTESFRLRDPELDPAVAFSMLTTMISRFLTPQRGDQEPTGP